MPENLQTKISCTLHGAHPYNTEQQPSNERIRRIRETITRAAKNKKGFAQGGIQDKRESRTECGVLVRNECKWGVQKNVREKTKERIGDVKTPGDYKTPGEVRTRGGRK
jgi:hypothetical protein